MMASPISRLASASVCSDSCHSRWSVSDELVESVFSIGGSSLTSCGRRSRLGGLEILGRHLFEQRVFHDLLVEEIGEFQGRHWKKLDRLLQRRRKDQLLCEPGLQLLLDAHNRLLQS